MTEMSYICSMKNNKKQLWTLLEKYDSDKNLVSFCDSISNVIQGKETEQDLINLIRFNDICEKDMNIVSELVDVNILF